MNEDRDMHLKRMADGVVVQWRSGIYPHSFTITTSMESGGGLLKLSGLEQAEGLLYALQAVVAEVKRQEALPAL